MADPHVEAAERWAAMSDRQGAAEVLSEARSLAAEADYAPAPVVALLALVVVELRRLADRP
jgi:hypothetical protein